MRITKKMKDEYKKIKEATRRKVRNTVKNQGAIIHDIQNGEVVTFDIRSKLNLPSIESFKSKKDFDEWMYEQRKFTSGRSPHAKFFKNDKGVVFTDYAKLVLQNAENKAEKVRVRELKKLEAAGLSQKLEQHEIMMARPSFSEMRKIKVDFNMLWNKGDIERKLIGLIVKGSPEDYREKRERMQENFIDLIHRSFNSDGHDLAEMIGKLSPDEFYALYLTNDWDFDDIYNAMDDNGDVSYVIGNIMRDIVTYKGDPDFQQNIDYLEPF